MIFVGLIPWLDLLYNPFAILPLSYFCKTSIGTLLSLDFTSAMVEVEYCKHNSFHNWLQYFYILCSALRLYSSSKELGCHYHDRVLRR